MIKLNTSNSIAYTENPNNSFIERINSITKIIK